MIPNEEKEGQHYLTVKNYLHYYMEQLQNISVILLLDLSSFL